ncbi:uncharacterized protein arhgef5 isoform X3 [Siphateles boraxobius]|uniref:uncharacterized protein arhgef5 isoform X3 n=1 Tax=Siphateles boraxobius TaxID=180520 RepID=UPI00406280F2
MDRPRDKDREMEPASYDWSRGREKFPATRRRDGEIEWRERDRRRDGDRHANGKSSVSEHAEYADRDNERRKGDTFPRMTKPSKERDERMPLSEYKREHHLGRQKDILYENERERERRRYRELDTQSEIENTRYREELKKNETRRPVKEEPERRRVRDKEFDSGRKERRRESYPGVVDLSGMRERETDRERDKLRKRDREDRYYPRLMEREIESFSDREMRTERQREGERSKKRDTKSEGDSDGDRVKERKREEDAKHGHKLCKSEGDSDADRRVHKDRERDRRRDREAERRQDMVMPRERDYRETGYRDPKGENLERLKETDKLRDKIRDSKEKRVHRDAYSYTTERVRYRDGERRERERYSEREIEERERRRRENREKERSKMEKSGQSSGELISGSVVENEQGREMRENPNDKERKNTSEIDKEKLTGKTEEEQEVKSAPREEVEGERSAAEVAVTKQTKIRIRKMWLEPRSERKESHLEEKYTERERARERYIQRYKESKTTDKEEEPEGKKENKKKSLEDKYRELERAGEFMRDVDVEREEKSMEGNVVCEREALEAERQMETENVNDNMEEEGGEEKKKNNRSEYLGNEEGSEGESEPEKDRIMSADDGFVTVSSGGDDAEEDNFEDCKESWDGGVAEDETAQGREIRRDEELENQTSNERADRRAPKGPLKDFCVIGQTLPESQTQQSAYVDTTVEEAANQHSSHDVDNQGEMSTANALEKVEHSEQDIERAMDDLSLSPNEDKGEKTEFNDLAKEGETSLEGQTIIPNEASEQGTQLFPTLPSETLGPCKDNGHGAPETHIEDILQGGKKEATGETLKHFDSDDTWGTTEERKRCSTAPHLRWAKNVVKEILGLNAVDTENTRGSVTHIDMQTNTQTEGEREMDKSREEEELTEGGERQGGTERELSEEHDRLDPSSIQHMVSLEGEADRKVEEQVSKKKDCIKDVVLSSSSFQDLGNESRIKRQGFRKTVEKTKEDEENQKEEEEEGGGVARDRRTRIFNISDGEEDELSSTWSEMDLRKLTRTKKRNSKFFNSQLYQEYSEVVQNREILLSHTDSLSISGDIRSSSSPNHSPKLSHRPLPPLPQVILHPHTLPQTNSSKSLNVPLQSINRPPSPRLSISASSPTLWQELPGVRNSPDFGELTEDARRLQEVRFEVVTSEASYCRSLDIVVENFVMSKQLNVILSSQDKNWLFSRLNDVRAISHRFLSHLEETVEKDMMHFTVCDIIIKHCPQFRNMYVPYLTNQSYQDKTYQRLMDESHEFRRVVEKLERNPVCQRLPLRSFLILPFQRITRLKLLVQNIVKRTAPKTKDEAQAIKAMKLLEKMIQIDDVDMWLTC